MANNPVQVVSMLQLYIIPDVERVAYVTLNANVTFSVCCVLCVCVSIVLVILNACALLHIYTFVY